MYPHPYPHQIQFRPKSTYKKLQSTIEWILKKDWPETPKGNQTPQSTHDKSS